MFELVGWVLVFLLSMACMSATVRSVRGIAIVSTPRLAGYDAFGYAVLILWIITAIMRGS